MKQQGLIVAVLCAIALAGCSQSQPTVSAEPVAAAAPLPTSAVEPVQPAPQAQTKACMIAGEFQLMGQRIRSRDCVQTTAAGEPDLQRICGSLAQTSAQMGGKAGDLTYLDACPSPSQGSCKGLFGGSFDGYYYERAADDLANLPASCAQGGGSWVAN